MVVDGSTTGVMVVIPAATIATVGTSIAPIGKGFGCFEVVARTVVASFGETHPKVDSTHIEGTSEVPAAPRR
jgi:hypothetical protein